ncbi:Fic family protein [Pseudomonas sp. ABC1]|nr:Fic family protein [Pseudomonas sp. ABC1]
MITDKNFLMPILPAEIPDDIFAMASSLPERGAFLDGRLAPATRAALASLLEVTNTYYSNLIEGQYSSPADLQQALSVPKRERKQLNELAARQIKVQKIMERFVEMLPSGSRWSWMLSPQCISISHKALFRDIPQDLLQIAHSDRRLIPGRIRSESDEQVRVGHHLAPDAAVVEPMLKLMQTWIARIEDPRMRLVATMAYHHRLAWVHPFMDGNGRLVRLVTHLQLRHLGLRSNLWSISRGLARRQQDYYACMANADRPREGDLDGRGQLSLKHYIGFIRFMFEVSLDQVEYMIDALDTRKLRSRIDRCFISNERLLERKVRRTSAAAVHALLTQGTMPRATFKTFLGISERLAIEELKVLQSLGLVLSASPKAREVSIGLPVWFAQEIFPDLHRRFA